MLFALGLRSEITDVSVIQLYQKFKCSRVCVCVCVCVFTMHLTKGTAILNIYVVHIVTHCGDRSDY